MLDRWLADRAYYRVALTDPGTDNPDQRIAEDLRMFVDNTLALGLGLMRSVVTLFSFIVVLWGLSGPVDAASASRSPATWSGWRCSTRVVGTALAHFVGRPLIPLNFQQQRVEADFRYALVRLRDNAEGIALYGGEADEKRGLLDALRRVIEQLVGHHGRHQAADLLHRRLFPGRGGLPLRRRRPGLFRRPHPARRADPDRRAPSARCRGRCPGSSTTTPA